MKDKNRIDEITILLQGVSLPNPGLTANEDLLAAQHRPTVTVQPIDPVVIQEADDMLLALLLLANHPRQFNAKKFLERLSGDITKRQRTLTFLRYHAWPKNLERITDQAAVRRATSRSCLMATSSITALDIVQRKTSRSPNGCWM